MKYLKAILSNYIFFILNSLFFIIITSISIKVMGEEYYGLFSILNAILIFSSVGTLGMGSVINKFSSEDGNIENDSILSAGVILLLPMGILSSGILFCIRDFITQRISQDYLIQQQFRSALIITSISLLPQFLGKIPYGFLLSQLKNKTARLTDLFSIMLLWIGAVVISLFEKNLLLISYWVLFVQIVTLIILFILSSRIHKWHWQINKITLKRMFKYSGYSFIESLAVMLFSQFDRIIVGITLGSISAGVYSVCTSVGGRIAITAGQATDVMIPYASKKSSIQENITLFKIFRKLSKAISLLTSFLGGILIIWMHEVISIWISPIYAEKYTRIFQIAIIAYSFISLSRPAHQTLMGIGKVRFTSIIYSITTILMLAILYLGSSFWGLIGAVSANLFMVFLLVYNLYFYFQNEKKNTLSFFANDLWCGIATPVISFIVISTIDSFLIKGILSIALFTLISIILLNDEFLLSQMINMLLKMKNAFMLNSIFEKHISNIKIRKIE